MENRKKESCEVQEITIEMLQQDTEIKQEGAGHSGSYTYMIHTDTCELVLINQNMESLLSKEVVGKKCYEVMRGKSHFCDDCPITKMRSSSSNHYTMEIFHKELQRWSRLDAFLLNLWENKECALIHCFDITHLKEEKPAEQLNLDYFTKDVPLYHALVNSTDDYIYMCDMKRNIFYFPERMVEEFALPGQVVENAVPIWGNLIHENDRLAYYQDLENMLSGKTNIHYVEYRAMNAKGNWVWVRCRGFLEHDEKGNQSLFAGVITNLETRSKIDHMSGLLNKYEFENHICLELENKSLKFGLLLLGIDNFKYINNLYGWDFGDEIIRITAQKIQSILPQNLGVYRLDGDTFGIFLKDTNPSQITEYYQLVSVAFHPQQEFKGHRYYCTLSAGAVFIEDEGLSFYTLFKRAEYALEYSKSQGKNRLSYYSEEVMSGKDRSLLLIEFLRESVDHNCENFELYYQPQVDAVTCKVKSAEALLRWHCDEFGAVSPVEFVPLLEQTGLIHTVGRFVLEEAAATCKQWRKKDETFVISVNLSYLQLLEQSFLPFLGQLLVKTGLDASALHVEITESCIASGSKSLTVAFDQIRALGIHIEMDDFGTGYSSLEILKNEPADVVKIDRAFVKDITKSDFDVTFIRFVVALCHSVNIKVCLEGVESWEEYDKVKPMGLDLIQGYLFGKPQSKEEFELAYMEIK